VETDEHALQAAAARQARTSTGDRASAGLARELSELARQLQAEPDVDGLMHRITAAAVRQVGGAAVAGITLLSRSGVETQAPTGQLAELVDRAQYELDEGPCLDSARRQVTVRCDDLRDETRWPLFARRAVELGVLSMLSVQLFVEGSRYGALNMYSPDPHAFDDVDESVGVLLASHAAIALHDQRLQGNLRNAMDVRDLVGQAKGMLMERYRIDVADSLVRTGVLPVPPEA
jgi:GAF domain-containing protein